MEALSFWPVSVRLARRLSIFLALFSAATQAAEHPALIPLPSSVIWRDGCSAA